MKKIVALMAAVFVWGCSSQPPVEQAPAKPSVEERTPTQKPSGGPAAAPVTPAPAPAERQVTAPAPKPAAVNPLKDPNNILSKRSVFFDYDKDEIKDEFRPLVQAHAKYLSGNPGAKMLIQGNCDERGSREYNIALGQRRSEALRRMLVLLGARDGQIEAVSLGKEKPRCTDQTDTCFSQNRRDDMLYGGEY
jgi:peptidoglycan-associated lipoprotein